MAYYHLAMVPHHGICWQFRGHTLKLQATEHAQVSCDYKNISIAKNISKKVLFVVNGYDQIFSSFIGNGNLIGKT